MTATTIETDIAAADELQLDRIAAQEMRNEVRAREARAQALHTANLDAIAKRNAREDRRVTALEADVARLQGLSHLTVREQIAIAIAPKYFTTGTGTGATAQADAIADAARFEFALDEACKVLDKPAPEAE